MGVGKQGGMAEVFPQLTSSSVDFFLPSKIHFMEVFLCKSRGKPPAPNLTKTHAKPDAKLQPPPLSTANVPKDEAVAECSGEAAAPGLSRWHRALDPASCPVPAGDA